MAEFLRTKIEEEQFEQLVTAIASGGGGGGSTPWVLGTTNVTSLDIQGLSADEFLVIQKVQLPNNKYCSTVFTFPKSSMATSNTMVDGYYYSANYYGTFGIKLSTTKIENDTSWVKTNYNGTTITNATIDVYYRLNQGGGGGSTLSQIYRNIQLGIGLNGNAWETLFTDTITIPNDGYYFVNSSFQKINGFGNGMLSTRILCDNVEMLNDDTENGTRASVSFNSVLNIGLQSNNIVYLTQGNHIFTVQAYSNMGTNPIGFCSFEIYK